MDECRRCGLYQSYDELEDGHLRLGLALEASVIQQLAFQRGEEALAHGVIEAVAP